MDESLRAEGVADAVCELLRFVGPIPLASAPVDVPFLPSILQA